MNVVFFTDRDLGLQFPAVLLDAGLFVERHRDHFVHDCEDVVWLREVAAHGWVMLTHDAWVYEAEAVDSLGLLAPVDRQYLFLPLAHVFAKVLQVLNTEHCTCGCGLTVAQCRIDDESCVVSLPLAQKLVKKVTAGK